MDSNIGKKLDGRYEITELIGVGGMADVYKAVDVMENRVVAVKILKDEFSQNEEFLRRFRNESKAIAVLSHPNIVKIYDVGFTDEIQFIVMEYIDGITLKEFIEQQGVLRWKDALHFVTQILRALQHAHDKGIVHRDIKPQNIMLFADGTIKVMDFGIARFSRVDGKTLSDKTIGSVHYISPEQARGDMTDERSDIYSVGVMLYEMLTGKKPFDGENPVAIALKHMQEDAVAPREIMPSIPEALEEIVIHAMERNPARRYQSAAEMIKDIDTFKLNQSVVFGYKHGAGIVANDEETTRFFRPVAADDDDDDEDEDEYDEYEDDEEDEKKRSYVVPILMAVTVAVVIIAALIIAYVLIKNFNVKSTHTGTLTIPNFVGQDIVQVQNDYKDKLNFNVEQQYSNEYSEGIIMSQSDTDKTVREGFTLSLVVSKGQKLNVVPDMKNKTKEIAMSELTSAGFVPKDRYVYDSNVPSGLVVKTTPEAGEQYPDGADVLVFISKGELESDVKVPNVVGLTEEKAIAKLTENKLTYSVQSIQHEGDKGKVIEQSVNAGEYKPKDTEIVIYVSTGETDPVNMQLKLPMPQGVYGSYSIEVNLDGNPVFTQNIQKAEAVAGSSVNVDISGKKIQEFTIYIRNNTTNKEVEYAKYTVDFDKQEATLEGSLNESGLISITPPKPETDSKPDSKPDVDSIPDTPDSSTSEDDSSTSQTDVSDEQTPDSSIDEGQEPAPEAE
ncbi:MAG: Stk1 family PASTA domain-containing Ser/Thr kinase [Oscillospiraceae bacterium]